MPTPELHPEIWRLVISHLRRPLPRPTGENRPADIRQPDLAVCMRVNRLFYDLTGTLLYSTIVSDYLPSLAWGLPPTRSCPGPAPGLKSKRQLLATCQHLYLEYADKDEPSYTTLLTRGGPYFLLLYPTIQNMLEFADCEMVWIAQAGKELFASIRHLKSFSTGVFMGEQEDAWSHVRDKATVATVMGDHLSAARTATTGLSVSPAPRAALCQRVQLGPLGLAFLGCDDRSRGKEPGRIPELRVHIDSPQCGDLPGVLGGHARWYAAYRGINEGREVEEAVRNLTRAIGLHVYQRQTELGAAIKVPIERAYFDVDIYLPPPFFQPSVLALLRQGIDEAVNVALEECKFPLSAIKRDDWRLKPLAEAPPCEACGWCMDDL